MKICLDCDTDLCVLPVAGTVESYKRATGIFLSGSLSHNTSTCQCCQECDTARNGNGISNSMPSE